MPSLRGIYRTPTASCLACGCVVVIGPASPAPLDPSPSERYTVARVLGGGCTFAGSAGEGPGRAPHRCGAPS